MASDPIFRVLADGLIRRAEELPRGHPAAGQLRDAAALILDADMALENDNHPSDPAKDAA